MIVMAQSMKQKKQEKKQSLVDASYDLFLSKGFNKTSIDEIVKKANVAKGTFYLYFKDKSDVMEDIMLRLSCRVLCDANSSMKKNSTGDFVEDIIAIVDYIIEYFKKNKLVLKLVKKDFSWPLIREKIFDSEYGEVNKILEECFQNPYLAEHSKDDIFKLLFVIIELCGSICYTSIINEQPDTIDNMKPFLYRIIRKILEV